MEYRKWAQAERAMEAHNGITKLPVRIFTPMVQLCMPSCIEPEQTAAVAKQFSKVPALKRQQ